VGYPFGFDAFDDSNYDQGDQAYAQDGGASQPQYPQDSQSMSESGNGVYPSLPPPDVADNQGPVGPIYRPEYHNDSSGAVHAQPATTLVFNDGRPNMQVHNYVLTSTVLYNLDGDTETEIPLSEINLQATEQANRSAGVDFSLPSGN
jgi:hypothetical protein